MWCNHFEQIVVGWKIGCFFHSLCVGWKEQHSQDEALANLFQSCQQSHQFAIHCPLSKTTMVIQLANSHAGYLLPISRFITHKKQKILKHILFTENCLLWLSSPIKKISTVHTKHIPVYQPRHLPQMSTFFIVRTLAEYRDYLNYLISIKCEDRLIASLQRV